MTIVDALEKAKTLARKRQIDDARQTPAAPVIEQPMTRRTADPAPAPVPPLARTEPVQVGKLLPFDAGVCSRHHILVPGVEPDLARSAAAPYRMMRALVLRRAKANNWACLAFTSPGQGEGKSTTSINLAISIAREGNHDVFLIDLDLRLPRVASYFGVSPQTDVVQYFEGKAAPHEILFSVGIDRLVLAAANTPRENSSELLANGRLEELLAHIRKMSPRPFVILDLPPVGVTDDALVVAPKVDATVLVVSQGLTRRDGLRKAIDLLSEHSLAGVIMNRSQEPLGTDYYGEYGH